MDYANKKLDVHTQYNHEYLIRIMYGKPHKVRFYRVIAQKSVHKVRVERPKEPVAKQPVY